MGVRVAPLRPRTEALPAMEGFRRSPLASVSGEEITPPKTTVTFAWNPLSFFALFHAISEPPLLVGVATGGPVFRDECVELFLSDPDTPSRYREIVVSAAGAVYGACVENLEDSRESWVLTPGLVPEGLRVMVSGDPPALPQTFSSWRCLLEVPWTGLEVRAPLPGEMRRGNATRIARGRTTRWEALSPTLRSSPADFHVPSRFATFVFG